MTDHPPKLADGSPNPNHYCPAGWRLERTEHEGGKHEHVFVDELGQERRVAWDALASLVEASEKPDSVHDAVAAKLAKRRK